MPEERYLPSSVGEDACLSREELGALLVPNSEVPPAVEAHLEHCENCRQRMEKLAGGDESDIPLEKFDRWEEENRKVTVLLAPIREAGGPDHTAPVSRTELCAHLEPATESDRASAFDVLGRLGHLQVIEIIGEGGMGVVFRARDPDLDREVAVKMLKPSLAQFPEMARQFFEEAKAVAAISHENIVPIHQVAETGGVPYFVMPLARHHTLQYRLSLFGQPTWEVAFPLCLRIARGLAAAHAAGILHRDVKPDNVLIESREDNPYATVWLADFGLARRDSGHGIRDSTTNRSLEAAGTPGFRAPEVVTGGDTDARSDLYGLGALFAELVSLPQAPPWFRDLVHQLRREKPDERPESAEEVLAVLQSHERDLAISHWFRQFLQRTGRSLGRAAIAIVPLAVVGTAIDVGMGSRFTNTALTGFGFGGIAVSGKLGVYDELADAVSAAESGDIITVSGPGYYVSRGCDIVGKNLTITGLLAAEHPRIDLIPNAPTDRPLIACRDGATVQLRSLSLVHEADDESLGRPLPPLIQVENSSLIAHDCEIRRLKVGDKFRPVAIRADSAKRLELKDCWMHHNRGVLIDWNGRNLQPEGLPEITIFDCLASCDRLLVAGPDPNPEGTLDVQLRNLKANLVTFFSFREGSEKLRLRAYIDECHIQTRLAFFSSFESAGDSIPERVHLTVRDSRLAHLGKPEGMPGMDLPAYPTEKGSPVYLRWEGKPLFIEQTWKLVE